MLSHSANAHANAREWQVLESAASAPVLGSELLRTLEAFAGAWDAVDDLGRRGLLADGADGADGNLTLTDACHRAHSRAVAGVATVRSAVTAALPAENYAALLWLLSDLVDGLDRTSKSSH